MLTLEWVEIDSSPRKLEEILAVDEALERLRQLDPQQARIVEMHYFAGMTVKETAAALGISPRTVDCEWALSQADRCRKHLQRVFLQSTLAMRARNQRFASRPASAL